jgi:hypothetical protein
LHDSLEDHGAEIVSLVRATRQCESNESAHVLSPDDTSAKNALAEIVGSRVADLVNSLSNDPAPKGLSLLQKHDHYRYGVIKKLEMDFDVFIIKLSDFTDNAVGLYWGEDPQKTMKVANKYFPLFAVFDEFVSRYEREGRLSAHQAALAREQMRVGKQRCEQFLALADS